MVSTELAKDENGYETFQNLDGGPPALEIWFGAKGKEPWEPAIIVKHPGMPYVNLLDNWKLQ